MAESGGSKHGSGSKADDVFDVRRVRRLVELMNEYELAEIDLRQDEQRIRLRKDQEPRLYPPTSPPVGYAPPGYALAGQSFQGPGTPSSSVPSSSSASGGSAESSTARHVVSPMVGTFYLSASPEAPPFVKVGDQVGPDTIVCIVEAMKVFNEIPAECSGKVVAVLVENGDAVEYGQKLFRLE